MAGRAGRPGFVKSEDVYILTIVSTSKDAEVAKQGYREDRIEEVESYLREEELEHFLMELVDAGYTTEEELSGVYKNTYSVARRLYDVSKELKFINPMAKKALVQRQYERLTSAMSSLIVRGWLDYDTRFMLTRVGKVVLDFLDESFIPWDLSKVEKVVNYFKKLSESSREIPLSAYDVALPIIEIFGSQLQIYPPKEEMEVHPEKIEHLRQEILDIGAYADEYNENSLFTWYILKERWAKGVQALDIEEEFGTWATYIDTITEPLAIVLEKLVKPLAEYYNILLSPEYDDEIIEIKYGVPRDVIPLLDIYRIGRVTVLRLYNTIQEEWSVFARSLILSDPEIIPVEDELRVVLETEGFLTFLEKLYLEAKKRNLVEDFRRFIEDSVQGIGPKLSQSLVEFLEERVKKSSH